MMGLQMANTLRARLVSDLILEPERWTGRDSLLLLLLEVGRGDNRLDVQRLLRLTGQLVAQPRLRIRTRLNDSVEIFGVNVSVLLVPVVGLVGEPSDDFSELGSRAGSVVVLAVSELDGVSENLEAVESGYVG